MPWSLCTLTRFRFFCHCKEKYRLEVAPVLLPAVLLILLRGRLFFFPLVINCSLTKTWFMESLWGFSLQKNPKQTNSGNRSPITEIIPFYYVSTAVLQKNVFSLISGQGLFMLWLAFFPCAWTISLKVLQLPHTPIIMDVRLFGISKLLTVTCACLFTKCFFPGCIHFPVMDWHSALNK